MPFPAVANPSPPPRSCLTPQKYFAAENAQLKLKFSPAGGRVGAQVKVAFSVFDAQTDQPAVVSPADVKATLEGPERLVVQTRGAANKYGVHLTAQTAGEYTVTATVRDKFTQKCTFRISAATDPKKCRIEGPSKVSVGPCTLKTICVDTSGHPLTTDLADQLSCAVSGPEGAYSNVESQANGDGSFSTTFQILKSAVFSIEIKINNEPVGNSPFKVSA